MNIEQVALRLVEDIYEAAHNPLHWPVALTGIAEALKGTSTAISVLNPTTHTDHIQIAIRGDLSQVPVYDRYYHRLNVHVAQATKHLAGTAASGDAIFSTDKLIRTEYYNDFLRPQDLFHILGCVLAPGGLASLGLDPAPPSCEGRLT